ncbi:MAG: HAMP domain-containing sensor histidine kinase, partial [bacterium]
MKLHTNCLFVNLTGIKPFKRCEFCEKKTRQCFGFQFFAIAMFIIALLMTTFFVSDLPALVIDIIIVIIVLVAILGYIASEETNEIIYNNLLLASMNKDLEGKVEQRTHDLNKTNENLKNIIEMQNEFIGIINHEMRNPLTSIISATEMILSRPTDKFDPNQSKLMTIIDKSGHTMLHLTNNLLDLSKIESGKIEIYNENIILADLIDELIQALRIQVDEKNLKFKIDITTSAQTIKADSERFKQVLFNLIENAIKYSSSGGTINISANDIDNQVVIKVQDQGIGIKKENLANIFDKFAKRQPGYKGTGL